MLRWLCLLMAWMLSDPAASAAGVLAAPAAPGKAVTPYVRTVAPVIALRNVRVIDGSGGPAQENRTVVLGHGRITTIGGPELAVPQGVQSFDLAGHSVLPGLVGMHDHLFYIASPNADAHGHSEPPLMLPQMSFSAPRLYLAAGVTTIRTAGSANIYADLNLKSMIDSGELPGPHIDVTGPFLDGSSSSFHQMTRLESAEDARRTVEFWAEQGVTSFKAYMNISQAQLKAVLKAAHRRGLKVTGHLCSITYDEAARLGIDNIEHGFFNNTQNDPGKTADVCPPTGGMPTLLSMDPQGADAAALIKLLIERNVTVTSTLAVFERYVPGSPPLSPRALKIMTPQAREAYLYSRNQINSAPREAVDHLRKAFEATRALEREFARAGGALMVGADPTGNGGAIPGFADHRAIELLVEGGLAPLDAIRIATLNGAAYLGLDSEIGSLVQGKRADLVVVKGDPSSKIGDIRNVVMVFKDGVAYDPDKLLESVQGRYGQY